LKVYNNLNFTTSKKIKALNPKFNRIISKLNEKKFTFPLLLFGVILLLYWQIAVCTAALKWDMLDVVFPFRYYFSTAMQAGHFPLWNPYLQTGSPFYADLQAPSYSPELLLVSSLGTYSVYLMHLLVIVYVFIAAFGMNILLQFFQYSRWSAFLGGIIYVSSGYFIGHGQHFFLLVGAVWIPWVLWSYLKMLHHSQLKYSIQFVVFCFLMLTSGYQALSLMLFYLLLFLFIQKVFESRKVENYNWKSLFGQHVIAVIILLVLLSPLLLATIEIRGEVERLSQGVSWEKAATYGQPFTSLLSLFSPLSVARTNSFFGNVDASMLNHYFGVTSLLFGIYGWNFNKNKTVWIIVFFGFIIGSLSFGELPIREFLFERVPFMNLFLQGPYIRVFWVLALVFLAVNGLEKWRLNGVLTWKKFGFPVLILIGAMVFIGSKWANFHFSDLVNNWLFKSSNFLDGWESNDFQQLLGFQLILNGTFLILVLLVIWKGKEWKFQKEMVGVLLVGELFINAQWNIPSTYTDRRFSPRIMQENIDLCTKAFPIPRLVPIAVNDDQHSFVLPFWRNTSIFNQQVSFPAFSSFELDGYSFLDDKAPFFRDNILQNPLVYLSDEIYPEDSIENLKTIDKKTTKRLFFNKKDFLELQKTNLHSSPTDQLKITGFSPNKMSFEVKVENQQILVLQQSFLNGWKAFCDNKALKIFRVNAIYQAIVVPQGKHHIQFEFQKPWIQILYWISQLTFLMLFFWLITQFIATTLSRESAIKFIFIPPILFVSTWIFILSKGEMNQKTSNEQLKFDLNKRSIVFSEKIVDRTIKAEEEYFTFGKWNYEQLKNAKTMSLSFDFKQDSLVPSLLVFEVLRKGKSVIWEVQKLERFAESEKKWNEFIWLKNLSLLEENDELQVYFWNQNSKAIHLKNIKIDFRKKN